MVRTTPIREEALFVCLPAGASGPVPIPHPPEGMNVRRLAARDARECAVGAPEVRQGVPKNTRSTGASGGSSSDAVRGWSTYARACRVNSSA